MYTRGFFKYWIIFGDLDLFRDLLTMTILYFFLFLQTSNAFSSKLFFSLRYPQFLNFY